ncbi:MAG: hypothetical protein LKJ94_01835 [Candidatus Methanomethylophilus sp.]|jgi:hypothetical protein|nr:hypothetical protein [Methanomethylophilus sp.]
MRLNVFPRWAKGFGDISVFTETAPPITDLVEMTGFFIRKMTVSLEIGGCVLNTGSDLIQKINFMQLIQNRSAIAIVILRIEIMFYSSGG